MLLPNAVTGGLHLRFRDFLRAPQPNRTCKWIREFAVVSCLIFFLTSWLPAFAQEARLNELNAQVVELYQQGKYAEAIQVADEAVRVARTTFGRDDPNLATALNNLGELYNAQGRYREAEPLLKQALVIRKQKLKPDDLAVATSLNNLGTVYEYQGRYEEAETLFKQALAIRQNSLSPNDPAVATSLNNLAGLYAQEGRYSEAEPFLQQALAIYQMALSPDHPDVATSLDSLAELYFRQGRYQEAEPLFKRALGIREKGLESDHPAIATSLNNLAGLYAHQGRYAESELFYKRALATRQKSLPPNHPDVAESLNNLAALYQARGRYSEAETLYKQALVILQRDPGTDPTEIASALNNLAELYQDQDRCADAEPLLKQALAIDKKALPPGHPGIATDLNNLASLYEAQKLYAEAEPLYRQALAIRQKVLGPNHPNTGGTLQNLALLYYAWRRPREAQSYFESAFQNLTVQFEQQFVYMNEKDRLGFLNTVSNVFPNYFSFVFTYHNQHPEFAGRMYDLLLWEKGLVADSVATQQARLTASGDAEALKLFKKLAAKRNQVVALIGAEPSDRGQWKRNLDQLQTEADDVEEQLVRRSAAFAESKRLARPSWRDVQKALGNDEAAVEVVRFEFHDGKKWTGKNNYAALVLTGATKSGPVSIDLADAAMLESALQEAYFQRIAPPSGGALSGTACSAQVAAPSLQARVVSASGGGPLAFYNSFWKPLEQALGGSKHIYISTDGSLNQMALGLIPTPKGNLLMESYDLRLLNRTADLLQPVVAHMEQSAVLFANPDFNLPAASYRKSLVSLGTSISEATAIPRLNESDTTLGGCTQLQQVRSLELGVTNQIVPLLREHGLTTTTYVEEQALVETVEQVQAPRLLHIATHGDFLPDPAAKEVTTPQSNDFPRPLISDPMLRSRLFFAGANHTLAGHPLPADLSDGILTAYQASTLNLHGTELVVLSACETGRGDVQDGEGVFGLRRAFQEAGAESVLMTLWEVPATETQELLNSFYRHWLSDGMDKHQALLAAQEDERKVVQQRYGSDLPYYWGAFVLVGR
jgi:tetratricopeptide (TPR) repeat protein/CHAT domain-containing protein